MSRWRCTFLAAALLAMGGTAWSQDTTQRAVPQRDALDIVSRIFGGKPDTSVRLDTSAVQDERKVAMTILPAISVNPTSGLALGASVNLFKRFGHAQTTNASTAAASLTYTTKKQLNLLVRTTFFGNNNRYLLQGDWRYLDTSQPTYGLGAIQPASQKDEVRFNLLRIYQSAFLPITGRFLVGIGYHLNNYFNIVDENAQQGLPSPMLDYYDGRTVTHHTSSGFSANAVFDSRDNPNNANRGYYLNVSFRNSPTWLGSTTAWQSIQTDFRAYRRLHSAKRRVIAVWATTWFTFGDVPYLELPANGWDTYSRSGRGYPAGRIRGMHQLYLEGEYRVTLTPDGLLGAVAFLNMIATSDPETDRFEAINPAAGIGLRIKLNKRSGVNIAIDFAVGEDGSNGLFLGTSEAF